MDNMASSTDEDRLVKLNQEFSAAEKRRDEAFFQSVLDEGLIFRRASAKRVNKSQYLSDLIDPNNSYEYNEPEDVEAFIVGDETALVSLCVGAKGTRSGKDFEGAYRNTRLFVKKEDRWSCVLWFNTIEKPKEPQH